MKKRSLLLAIVLIIGITTPFFSYAAWDTNPYDQGETLNPECSPEDENCTVSIPAIGNLFSLDGITYIGTLAEEIDSPSGFDVQRINNASSGKYQSQIARGHEYRIYAYYDTGDGRVYSTTYAWGSYYDDDINQSRYDLQISWESVDGADGYRVFTQSGSSGDGANDFNIYYDTTNTSFTDDTSNSWTDGKEVLPKGIPFAVNETTNAVGIGMLPSSDYALAVGGDTFTNGGLYFGNQSEDSGNAGSVHLGNTGYYGQASGWAPNHWNASSGGIWIEGTNGEEGGGFYADGDMSAIWSAGDIDLLRVYDEDALRTDHAAFIIDGSGGLRSDIGDLNINDSLTVGVGNYNNEEGPATDDRGLFTIQEQNSERLEYLENGTLDGTNHWSLGAGWSYDDGHVVYAPGDYGDSDTYLSVTSNQNVNSYEVYDVSFDVGGTTGALNVCLGSGDCEVFDAGQGSVDFSGNWEAPTNESSAIMFFYPSVDFDGTIDNVSIFNQVKPAITVIDSSGYTSVSFGVDSGEITDALGFKITTNEPGNIKSGSLFFGGEADSHYGYILPSLATVDGGVDTICTVELGNCAGGDSAWTQDGLGISYVDGNVGIGGESSSTALFSVYGYGASVNLSSVASYDSNTPSRDVAIWGDTLFLAGGTYLDIFDISNPEVDSLLSQYDFGTSVQTVRVSGTIAYVAAGNTVSVLDVHDLGNTPVLLGTYTTDGTVADISLGEGVLYTLDANNHFYILDISGISTETPADPVLLNTSVWTTSYTTDTESRLSGAGDVVYITEEGAVQIIDVSDNSNPTLLSTYVNGNTSGAVVAFGNYAYIHQDTGGADSFYVLDVGNPTDPSVIGTADAGTWRINTRMVLNDGYIYLADGNLDSVYVIDVSDPEHPRIVDHVATDGNAYGVAVSGDNIYVADGNAGVQVFEKSSSDINSTFVGGKVGIGTETPLSLLHISGGTSNLLTLQNTTGDEGSTVNIDFQTYQVLNGELSPTARISAIDDGSYSSGLVFYTKNPGAEQNELLERLRIASNGNIGIGSFDPQAMVEIYGSGSGEFAGDYPSLLNIHTTNETPWGITFQNDAAGDNNEMGVFLNDDGSLVFGSQDGDEHALAFGQSGQLALGATDFSDAKLTIKQNGLSAEEQITNGAFDGNADSWTLEGGWTYSSGHVSFAAPNPSGTIQSLGDLSIQSGGTGYSVGEYIGLDGGNHDVSIEVLAVIGTPNSFAVATAGSGYEVGDILTVANYAGDPGSVSVDSVDGGGAITGVSLITPGTNYYTDVNYSVSGGHGSDATIYPGNDFTGAIRSLNVLASGGTGYSTATYNVTGTGSGASIYAVVSNSYGNLHQDGTLVDGDTYDVALTVGGDTGTVVACLDDGDCHVFNAGEGSVSFSGVWLNDYSNIIRIYPSSDFNGTIDDVSVFSYSSKNPGLTIINSDNATSLSLGVDYGDIAPAAGIKFTMDYGEGQTAAASFFLSGEMDSHYGYILPSLSTLGGSTSSDTFCMQDLGNCSSGVQSLTTVARDALISPSANQVIFNTDTKTMQYYTASDAPFTLNTTNGGSAAHAEQAMGETFTPTESGVLRSVAGSIAARPYGGNTLTDELKADVIARIYDEPNGTLLATSDNVVTDNDNDESGEFSFVDGTWTFDTADLSLVDGTVYYIEFSDTDSAKNALYFKEQGSETYTGGAAYGGAPGNTSTLDGYDLYFVLLYGGTSSGTWTDVSSGTAQQWTEVASGIHYSNGNVGIGNTAPRAGIDVVGASTGVGFSQIAWYSDLNTWTMDAVVSGDKLFSADGAHLDIFDITDPTDETILTTFDFSVFGVTPNTIRVVGDMAYVGAGSSVYVLDVSYASQGQVPVLLGGFESWNTVRDLQIDNGVLYVIDDSYDFYALDVSNITPTNPGNPELMTDGAYETYSNPTKMALSGNYIYISEYDDMVEVYDVTDPYNPVFVSGYQNGADYFAGGIAAKDKYVYATRDTDDGESFVVLDATDPGNLVQVGSADIGTARYDTRITISGNIAYVADGALDSIYAINISYPTNPIIVGYGTTNGNSYAVAPYKNVVFVADGAYGVVVLSAPITYSALFNGGNVGIGTNDPAFNLDVGAKKATAMLTLGTVVDEDGFMLRDQSGDEWFYEFDDTESLQTGGDPIVIYGLTHSQIINQTVAVINNSGFFKATRSGDAIEIEQLAAGQSGNTWNEILNDDSDPITHPTHSYGEIELTDFTGGVNGDINFGGNLYQHGQLFTGSQWSDTEGGISYVGGIFMSGGDVSMGDGSFLYDNETGVTSIDNLSLGALTFAEDAGAVSWIDLPISGNATDGTVESYTASIGGLDILTIHGTMDTGVLVGTGIRMDNLPTISSNATSYLCIDANNEVVAGNDFDGCDVSSIRFKQNVNALTDDSGLAEVMQLNPVSFFYKPEFNGALQSNVNFSGEQVGFIAEEVRQVDPRLIVLESDGTTPHGVRYDKITSVLVKAVKEIGAWTNHFFSKQVDTDKLCVGDTCVTQAEFLRMIQSSGATPLTKNSAQSSEPVPEADQPESSQGETPSSEVPSAEPSVEPSAEPSSDSAAPELSPAPEVTTPPEAPSPEIVPVVEEPAPVDQTPVSDSVN